MGASFSLNTTVVKFLQSNQLFHRYEPNYGKCPILECLRLLKKILTLPDPDVDDFHNLTDTSLSTDTYLVHLLPFTL